MTRLAALNDTDGKPVDWWFIYKLPSGVGEAPAKGFNMEKPVWCIFEDSRETGG